jgi:hypothetical protein
MNFKRLADYFEAASSKNPDNKRGVMELRSEKIRARLPSASGAK